MAGKWDDDEMGEGIDDDDGDDAEEGPVDNEE